MRVPVVIVLSVSVAVCANPVVLPPRLKAYIGSEKLVVTFTPTDATFTATFSFRSDEGAYQWSGTRPRPALVALPIWFPENGADDPIVARFWRTFRKDHCNLLTTNATARDVFDDSIKLKVRIGEHELSTEREIGQFWAFPDYTAISAEHAERFDKWTQQMLKQFFAGQPYDRLMSEAPVESREPGFYCLVLTFSDSSGFVQERTPVRVTYRQPLARANGEGRFFYVPIFDNLPKNASTDNTNRYSITLVAAGCTVEVGSGDQQVTIKDGREFTIAPQHLQPIRARSIRKPRAPHTDRRVPTQ